MRYESIPRKVINTSKRLFNFMKEEFGNWAYLIIAFMVFLLHKPILNILDWITQFILYIFITIVVLFIGYRFFKKMIK